MTSSDKTGNSASNVSGAPEALDPASVKSVFLPALLAAASDTNFVRIKCELSPEQTIPCSASVLQTFKKRPMALQLDCGQGGCFVYTRRSALDLFAGAAGTLKVANFRIEAGVLRPSGQHEWLKHDHLSTVSASSIRASWKDALRIVAQHPEWLLLCAQRELRDAHPQQYLALFLCLWAGLRRKEADLLTWQQIAFDQGQIQIRRTAYFEPKTEESQRDIDLSPEAVEVLRGFMKGTRSEFVLEGGDPRPESTYDYYRCDCTWRELHDWLRAKGVRQKKAIHALRKESGSLIASNFGIEAARQHLGHRDIRTTSSHYVEKRKRVEVRLPIGLAATKPQLLTGDESP